MPVAITALALLATVTAVAGLARRFDLSAPLLLTLVGVVASFLPFVPEVHLSSEVVLVGLLPPLLYAAAIRSSLVDFKENRRPIGFLSVGLVIFTALGVGLLTWWLLPVPFAAAFALGAVVAPPDAVAATAIARRIGLPRRVVTLLEGESLVNDATALVCLRTAIAALTVGYVSVGGVTLDFVRAALGGVVIGVVVAWLVGLIRKAVTDSVIDTSLSFMVPFVAYLPAEELGASGVLAVVVAGLLLGHRSSVLQDASSRLSERVNWSTIQFLLENSVFLLIGLQVRWIVADVSRSDLGLGQIIGVCLAVLAAVIVLRPMWVFPVRFLAIRPGPDRAGRVPSWRSTAIISWAGMRGVVTLAAVFALPEDTPAAGGPGPHRHGGHSRHAGAARLLAAVAGPSPRGARAGPARGRPAGGHRPAVRGERRHARSRRVRRRDRRADDGHAAPPGGAARQHRLGAAGQHRLDAGDTERGLPPGPPADAGRRACGGAPHPRRRERQTTRCSSR